MNPLRHSRQAVVEIVQRTHSRQFEGAADVSEMHDLIIELRSMTLGVGTFQWKFDHLQELSGKEADTVVSERAEALADH